MAIKASDDDGSGGESSVGNEAACGVAGSTDATRGATLGATGGAAANETDNESLPILKPHQRPRNTIWRLFDDLRQRLRQKPQESSENPRHQSASALTSSVAATSAATSAAAPSSLGESTDHTSMSSSIGRCFTAATRRKFCFAIIGIYLFLDGLEGGFIIPTLWLLLENKFHLQSDGYFLGFTVSSFCAASLVFSPIAGKFSDLLKTAKPLLLASCLIRVASNSLYFISYNKWFVYAGRLLSGVGAAVTPALVADVARATKAEERTKVIHNIFILRNIGNVAGYMIIPVFSFCDFNFAGIQVNKLNAAGFFAAILFLVSFFLAVLFYFDLSQSTITSTNEHHAIEGPSALAGIETNKKEQPGCGGTLVEGIKKSWAIFAVTIIREELLIVFFTGFISMFNLGGIETALFPLLELLFDWTIFKHPLLFFGALLIGIVLLIVIFKIGQNFKERGFFMTILLISCGSTLLSLITWTLALNTDAGENLPQVVWELLVGGGAFLLIIFVNAVVILTSGFLSLVIPLESQGVGQGYLQTVKMIGNMMGPLWAGEWENVPVFLGMQLGLLTFVAVLFGFSWDKMKGETNEETNGQQQNQQRVMSENDQLNYQQLPSGGSIQ